MHLTRDGKVDIFLPETSPTIIFIIINYILSIFFGVRTFLLSPFLLPFRKVLSVAVSRIFINYMKVYIGILQM